MEEIEIFTDGACRGNPGLGGWGALVRRDGEESSLWGGEKETTNNRMEMEAAIKGLESIIDSSNITITTDSNYLKDGITQERRYTVPENEIPGNQNVILASVDTGVDWDHNDLVGNLWQNLGEDADGEGDVLEYIDGELFFDPDDTNSVDDDGD